MRSWGTLHLQNFPKCVSVAHRRYRLTENLKNQAITCCPRMSDRLTENLKN
ncbi:hypothetical protein IQ274_16055 [Nostoc sp. LEGE 12447]|uniref:hypothetical protein n=1 Tax=Nostoc sp. LEGE 12447 TaxID=1828640 RepID=UPI0018847F1E|nr:hypothetical protein [Nostoc sp. LEGE 12447]MBE8999707.1 hypothetical protein [Nostoc sp. LEGE 12447]